MAPAWLEFVGPGYLSWRELYQLKSSKRKALSLEKRKVQRDEFTTSWSFRFALFNCSMTCDSPSRATDHRTGRNSVFACVLPLPPFRVQTLVKVLGAIVYVLVL